MPLTASNRIAIGTEAPDFRLQDADGRTFSPADVADGKALLVAFLSTQGPFAGSAFPTEQRQAIGCNIKWRAGDEPTWFQTSVAAE